MLRIVNGKVYDPANGVDGDIRTIAAGDGRIVAESDLPPGARTIDARGMLVLPGGVDLHSHIAGPKVNAARKMRPEDHRRAEPVRRTAVTRSGVMGANPSTFALHLRAPRLHDGVPSTYSFWVLLRGHGSFADGREGLGHQERAGGACAACTREIAPLGGRREGGGLTARDPRRSPR
jgi:hypothetical protein